MSSSHYVRLKIQVGYCMLECIICSQGQIITFFQISYGALERTEFLDILCMLHLLSRMSAAGERVGYHNVLR